MTSIEYDGFTFTVTHLSTTNFGTYYHLVMSSANGYKAQAALVDEQGKLSLLDIRMLQTIGLYGMLSFCEELNKISHEAFPMIVDACQQVVQDLAITKNTEQP